MFIPVNENVDKWIQSECDFVCYPMDHSTLPRLLWIGCHPLHKGGEYGLIGSTVDVQIDVHLHVVLQLSRRNRVPFSANQRLASHHILTHKVVERLVFSL